MKREIHSTKMLSYLAYFNQAKHQNGATHVQVVHHKAETLLFI
jgi:hypothetical protein